MLGGYTADGGSSRRADAYSPERDSWRRLPDLPVGVNHAMAVGVDGRAYLSRRLRGFRGRRCETGSCSRPDAGVRCRVCRSRARQPGRASRVTASSSRAGSAKGAGSPATRSSSTCERRAGRSSAGPTPREHLAVASLGGVVYAVGGRTSGLDTNLLHFESFRPGDRSWKRLQAVPDARGGTGAAGLAGQIVSVGGEEPTGTIAEVLAYRVAEGRWVQLAEPPDSAARRRRRRARRPGLRDRRRAATRPDRERRRTRR